MVEHALGTAHGAVAGAGTAKTVGKSTASVFDKANKALEAAGTASGAPARTVPAQTGAKQTAPAQTASAQTGAAQAAEPPVASQPAPEAAPAPAAAVLNPSAITPGLDRQEVLAKLGKPSMQLSSSEDSELVEKYWYKTPGRENTLIILRNGKVASISTPAVLP